MQVLSTEDYKMFISILKTSKKNLLKVLSKYVLKRYEKNVIWTDDYLIGIGDIPIALVAHVDTVFPKPPKDIYYDKDKGVIWSPFGLGADDRAGVFAILKILQRGLKPTVIFTMDEELGGLGADQLVKDFPFCPIEDLRYIIQLDRCGTNDCVFYDCDNDDFVKYVESFGFIENYGSFSDISILSPAWGTAGVNLSIGYNDEHTYSETFHVGAWNATLNKVISMLKSENIPHFEYIENTKYYRYSNDWNAFQKCEHCGKYFSEYELVPTYTKKKKIKYYCPDCCVDHVEWCDNCGAAYQKTLDHCPDCGTFKGETNQNA